MMGREGEDLGGAVRPLSEGSPYPPNLPDPPLTSPQDPHHDSGEDLFRLFDGGGLVGKFLVWAGGANLLQGAASHPIGKRNVIRYDALCGISKHQGRKAILQVIFLW